LAFGGEGVGGAAGVGGGGDGGDQAVGFEAGEAVGEDVGGDAFGGLGEVVEAGFAGEEVADEEEGPFVAEQVECAGDGAGGTAVFGGGGQGDSFAASLARLLGGRKTDATTEARRHGGALVKALSPRRHEDTKEMRRRLNTEGTESTEEVTEKKGNESWTTDYTDGHG